jgi:tetratricopeptide (TPR) repeat protein
MSELAGLLQNAAAYEVRGAEALEQRQWAEAVANLRKAIALAPNNALTHVNLGTALFLMDDAPGALEQFETAVRLSPELPKAHFSIGVILEGRGRDGEAIDAFSAALERDPNYVEARMQLADALRRNGRVEESLSHYAEVLKSTPSVSQARFGSAMALVRLGRFAEARDSIVDGMKTFRDQPGFAHALARLLAAAPDDRVRDGPRALALMNELLAKQKTIALAETMAMTLAELGRFDEAVSWQRQAMAAAQGGRDQPTRAMAVNLKLYESSKPCRTPWAADDPVFYPRPAR